MKHGKLAFAAALISATFGAQATVLEWGFVNNTVFSNAVFGPGTGTTIATGSELSWGSGSGDFTAGDTGNASLNRSALTIGTGETGSSRFGGGPASATGGVFTNSFLPGEIGLGVTMTHWNNPINASFGTLTSATLTDSLTLIPVTPSGSGFDITPDLVFSFQFRETSNAGPCAGGTATPCGDLFGFAGTPNLNIPFSYDGEDYFASILVMGPDFLDFTHRVPE